jgi:hypothetical protein
VMTLQGSRTKQHRKRKEIERVHGGQPVQPIVMRSQQKEGYG